MLLSRVNLAVVVIVTLGMSSVGCAREANQSTPPQTPSFAAVPSPPPGGDRWPHPFPTNGCRYAFPQEIAAASGISVTSEVDRGSSGCTYNNGEDAFSATTFVGVDMNSDFDRLVQKLSGKAEVNDASATGLDAKWLNLGNPEHPLNSLLVRVDGKRAIVVEIEPNGTQDNSAQVARLIMARMKSG